MKYIKYFETIEEYESWMKIEENAEEVYQSEEKICVDGVILPFPYLYEISFFIGVII